MSEDNLLTNYFNNAEALAIQNIEWPGSTAQQ